MNGKLKTWIRKLFDFTHGTYDTSTKQISGVKYGSWGYYHEEGHKKQDESGRMGIAFMWMRYIMYFVVAQILWKIELGVLVYLIIAPELYLELDAWWYAYKKKRAKKWG